MPFLRALLARCCTGVHHINVKTLEAVAALLTLVNVALVVRRSVWNFPFALVAVSLTAIVLWQDRLYSDAGLQGFFFVLNLVGWAAWRANAGPEPEISVERLDHRHYPLWIGGTILAIFGWGLFMQRMTNASAPFLDAGVAMISVAGQLLLVRRKIENWHFWIAVNVLSIGLYASRGMYWFTGLYVILLALAVRGLADWRAAEQRISP